MNETGSENRLRVFAGELFVNPAPLECSFNLCTRCPGYCFAWSNERDKQDLTASATVRHIERVFREGGNPTNFADILLLRKHSVVYGNSVDPLFPKNIPSTRLMLPLLRALEVPVILQTRGTDKPRDFPQYLEMLDPDNSVIYVSLTTDDPEMAREVEPGSPTHEERCEMIGMAAERGFNVVAALNPFDKTFTRDVEGFFETIDRIAGLGAVKGAWCEPLHVSATQLVSIRKRYEKKGGVPEVFEEPLQRASMTLPGRPREFVPDDGGFFWSDVWALMDERDWRRYSHGIPWLNRGRADLFDLWPNPFPTHHAVVAACREASEQAGGAPVLVEFATFCSWIEAQSPGVLDIEISRADARYWINIKNNVDKTELKLLPPMTLREALRIHWQMPASGAQSIWSAYGLYPAVAAPPEDAEDIDPVLRDDDGNLVAVWTERHDVVQRQGKLRFVAMDDLDDGPAPGLLLPCDEDGDDTDEAAAS